MTLAAVLDRSQAVPDVRDHERDIWGNGRLTLGARLASVVGWPVAALLLGILTQMATELRTDVRRLHEDKIELTRVLENISGRLSEQERRNMQQDNRFERLDRALERLRPPPLHFPQAP